ncbi:hypothetical protein EB796_018473 [Bugula neritina]|uniref:Uncharacterized protein n=1 Tax=Bugula neritina TaxID=10212 RepID=A0A7J7JCY0_BUGNE|nr:hypothetical protein EB796_018473 [Bugula neritina]
MVCEDDLGSGFCRYKQLVNQKTRASCLSARSIVADAITDCVVKNPVKRVSLGIQVVLLFQRNCGNFYIDFPTDGCGRLAQCVATLFESDGKTVNCSKRDVVNQCYENARKDGCSLTSNIENLVAQRFASQICPAVRPALPTNCY